MLRALVWAVFATPLGTFLGWLIARRHEGWLAAYVCFCIYFFSPFIGARIESLFFDPTAAEVAGHPIYFPAVIILNLFGALAIVVWRGRTLYALPEATPEVEESPSQPAEA